MAGVNRVILIGRLGRDPDEHMTTKGEPVVSWSLATSRRHTNAAGETEEATEWHECVAFRQTATVAKKFLRKGALVYVEGRIQSRKYTGRDGAERTRFSIIVETFQFLESKARSEQAAEYGPAGVRTESAVADEVPF